MGDVLDFPPRPPGSKSDSAVLALIVSELAAATAISYATLQLGPELFRAVAIDIGAPPEREQLLVGGIRTYLNKKIRPSELLILLGAFPVLSVGEFRMKDDGDGLTPEWPGPVS